MNRFRNSILIGVFVALALHALAAGGPGVSGPQHNVGSTAITGGTSNRLLRNNAGVLANSLLSDDGTKATLTSGQLLVPDSSATAPAYSFTSSPGTGIFQHNIGNISIVGGGTPNFATNGDELRIRSTGVLSWASGDPTITGSDVLLSRAAANVLQLATGDSFRLAGGKIEVTADARTIATTGDANPATLTLTPTASYVEITCNDPDTCDITMGETGIVEGTQLNIVNVGTNVVDFADTVGVSEIAGAFAAAQFDSILMRYTGAEWVETARSNN